MEFLLILKKENFNWGFVKTHGSNKKVISNVKNFKFTSFNLALKKVLNWYNSK